MTKVAMYSAPRITIVSSYESFIHHCSATGSNIVQQPPNDDFW
ncbi:hypothetical protein MY4824_003424 [Beauveria thailandica]